MSEQQRSTEDRVHELESHFKVADYKLDALIESVREVNGVVKKLADIANTQAITNLQVTQIQKEISNIENNTRQRLDDFEKDKKENVDPVIEQSKTYMNYAKAWLLVAGVIVGGLQAYAMWAVQSSVDYASKLSDRVTQIEHKTGVVETKLIVVDDQIKELKASTNHTNQPSGQLQ